MRILDGLGTDNVFYFFEEITRIPHGSGNEGPLAAYLMAFAQERGLECRKDNAGNVVIKKPGTAGYEKSPAVILQGHMDMVCEKLAGVEHDFTTEPLQLEIDGDLIRAKGTTLGADNGIAVAYMLAALDAGDMAHPPLEAVFTTGEETGMEGAKGLDCSDLKGKYLINMDTEEEGKFLISCCGGRREQIVLPVEYVEKKEGQQAYLLTIKGLKGGHSGSDIHLNRASANKLLGRILHGLAENVSYDLVRVDGGNMDNAICREAEAVLMVTEAEAKKAAAAVAEAEKMLKEEYRRSDGDMIVTWESLREQVSHMMTEDTKQKVISILMLLPFGVESMSMEVEGLVESSSNPGILKTEGNAVYFDNAVRSSVASKKELICQQIHTLAKLCGGKCESRADYPGWMYQEDSRLLTVLEEAYRRTAGKEPERVAIHAGVECGLFAEKMPWLDMVSLGPEMYDVHTPDERLSISSVKRTWELLKATLAELK
ncbi:aminoacyl-histidine dipeptidase [Anaerotignum lactatifermentans]|uniref:Aminoacyl-histidine dipeptidase n=1 Tax=Anaerotignum lactatifermentans TaxID=160404 RepID=A0ABS2GB49_9FIRM|nr:aminoacyl-histidine dipeptidase [Anaerotignum lactatifermentans]MBM6830161.1 aminoacyl-histidine dipeptidase [Anaerotignum lactatifermentans]MBM6878694.1 aminoacyl-histidine dipeptidase [Anaerotignum lactatifermentans]MBM6951774.1 aminoacyl-histidine dipeptidase [Anaerotignum lactatifermentans]